MSALSCRTLLTEIQPQKIYDGGRILVMDMRKLSLFGWVWLLPWGPPRSHVAPPLESCCCEESVGSNPLHGLWGLCYMVSEHLQGDDKSSLWTDVNFILKGMDQSCCLGIRVSPPVGLEWTARAGVSSSEMVEEPSDGGGWTWRPGHEWRRKTAGMILHEGVGAHF